MHLLSYKRSDVANCKMFVSRGEQLQLFTNSSDLMSICTNQGVQNSADKSELISTIGPHETVAFKDLDFITSSTT